MMRPCRDVEAWLGRSAAALDEAQQLSLEQHLASCVPCRDLHEGARAITRLVHEHTPALSNAARSRAIAGAFVRAAQQPVERRSTWWLSASIAAVAAAALLLVWRSWPAHDGWIENAQQETHHFAHASVTMAAGSRARFDEARATLMLARGAADVAVDPRPHAPFAVQTSRLRVEVLGTQFHVEQGSVAVQHGRVRVLRGGRTLAELKAGQSYDLHAPPKQVVAPAPAPEPAMPAATPVAPKPRVETASVLLERARAALARDALDETRKLLVQAEHAPGKRADRAEAGVLRAELALRARDPERAAHAYLDVARRFAHTAAGENALFAAAQLRARAGHPEAKALLARYLAEYPQGRFRDEARARLSPSAR